MFKYGRKKKKKKKRKKKNGYCTFIRCEEGMNDFLSSISSY